MDIKTFYNSITTADVMNEAKIASFRKLLLKYPYFQSAIFAYLKALYLSENEEYEEELKRLSIFINDRKALFFYIFSDLYKEFLEQTGQENLPEDKTKVLLEAFFSTRTEERDLDEIIEIESSVVSADYLSFLDATNINKPKEEELLDQSVPLKHQGIIDSFIKKTEAEEIHLQPLSNNSDFLEAKQYIQRAFFHVFDDKQLLIFIEILSNHCQIMPTK